MRNLFHSNACIAGIVIASGTLVGLWIAGSPARTAASARWEQSAAPAIAAPSGQARKPTAVPVMTKPVARLTHKKFAHDLRRPRAPRHRSERPSSFSAEHESLAAATIHFIIHDDIHRPFVADVVFSSPLSGHPLQLLRPPSARAA